MAGKVIQTLRISPPLAVLAQSELAIVAGCGRRAGYPAGVVILGPDDAGKRMFVLQEGRVTLHICMQTEGGHCGGEAEFELDRPGQAFGWSAWVRPDRISASAVTMTNVTLVVVDLDRLNSSPILWKVRQRMLQALYAMLQQSGLCPANVQALLRLGHVPH